MHKITFKTISIEGFRSFVIPQEFNFNVPGLHLIKGTNGAGKTTLFEALIWCIYGTNLKDTVQDKIPSWPETRTNSWRGTRVMLTFELDKGEGPVTYQICRHINFQGDTQGYKPIDRLMIFLGNELVGGDLNKDEIQEHIDRLIGVDNRTFLNSVLFGQRMAKLISQDNKDKRELFEELFDMEWVKELKIKADARLGALQEELVSLEVKLKAEQVRHRALQEHILTNQNLLDTYEKSKNERLESESKRLSDLTTLKGENQKQLQVLQKDYESVDYPKIRTQHETINKALQNLIEQEANLSREIVSVENEIMRMDATIEHLTNTLEEKKAILQGLNTASLVADLKNKIAEIQHKFKVEQALQNDLKIKLQTIPTNEMYVGKSLGLKALDTRIFSLKASIERNKTELAKLTSSTFEIGNHCYTCGQELKEGNRLTAEVNQKISDLSRSLPVQETELAELEGDKTGLGLVLNAMEAYFNSMAECDKRYSLLTGYKEQLTEIESGATASILNKDIKELTAQINDLIIRSNATVDKKESLENDLNDLQLRVGDEAMEVDNLEAIIAKGTKIEGDMEVLSRDIKASDLLISEVARIIEQKQNEEPPQLRIVEMKEEEQVLSKDIEGLTLLMSEKESQVEIAKWWSSKALGASGIKAYIFKAMLSQLNHNIKKYGDRLGVSMEFSIDLSKASKPFTTTCSLGDKINKDYKEFSGGQKQRLDIVLIFAMYDLIASNFICNVLLMDEIFEGLDEEGEAVVFDLIRTKMEDGKAVFIIDHSVTIDSLYSTKIEFECVGGITKIK